MQADGLSLFRMSSNGDIYTSANGSVRTGGADLAENYSSTEPLEKGEVVSIDPITDHSVKRTLWQNQPDVLGVVSSRARIRGWFVHQRFFPDRACRAGAGECLDRKRNIKVGDYLTASAVPGHAMRATKSGRVIGKALEDLKTRPAH